MEEIKYLGVRNNKTGDGSCSWSLFLCPYCNKEVEKIRGNGLKTQSCGCHRNKAVSEKLTKHGQSKGGQHSRVYRIWSDIKTRCRNTDRPQYKWYGGKGIDYCAEWESFEVFLKWSLENGYSDGLQIDRVDNNKGYEPVNCRWVTQRENNRNRSSTKLTESDACDIKNHPQRGKTSKEVLSIKYGVSTYTIDSVWYGKNWNNSEVL